jgi:hypothetical protein
MASPVFEALRQRIPLSFLSDCPWSWSERGQLYYARAEDVVGSDEVLLTLKELFGNSRNRLRKVTPADARAFCLTAFTYDELPEALAVIEKDRI